MKRTMLIAMAVFGLSGSAWAEGPPDKAEKKPAKEDKLTGEVLDLNCYVGHGAKGEKHADCAQKCITGGAPVGILSKGKVYVVVNTDHTVKVNEKLAPMAGKTVTLVGHEKKIEGGGHAFDMASLEEAPAK